VKRPRIYGNEGRCRAALTRYITRAEELLDQANGVQNRLWAVAEHHLGEFYALAIQDEWETDVRRWFASAIQGMGRYLQEQTAEVLPVLDHMD
jgi:hypothetical protein